LHTGHGGGVPASLIMDQTEEVESVNVLGFLLENLTVKLLSISQAAVLMMAECEL
jgi:hypothetical protein